MTPELNAFGQPVGFPVPGWKAVAWPSREAMIGRFCRLEPLDPMRHAEDLHAANALDLTGRMWGYLSYGPFDSVASYRAYMETHWLGDDPLFLAIIDQKTGQAVGVASYLRIEPLHGVIEVGHLAFSPLLQRTAAATEAMYLMMERIFTLGYRRYEWKCHALNAPSRAAAQRLGFSFEGVFRQAMVTRGRNRDTAWYSIIDPEWPALREAFHKWLAPSNFDGEGRQKESLSNWTASLLQNKG